jgi:hypothetical protein
VWILAQGFIVSEIDHRLQQKRKRIPFPVSQRGSRHPGSADLSADMAQGKSHTLSELTLSTESPGHGERESLRV